MKLRPLAFALMMAATAWPAARPALRRVAAKKPVVKRPTRAAFSAAARAKAQQEISAMIAADNLGLENADALAPFFAALAKPDGPLHILQFGDSHTASDDLVNSLRTVLQSKYGNGGPGFIHAGRPFKGYRRFDARATATPHWKSEGTLQNRGDAWQGLGGISISTTQPKQTITVDSSGQHLALHFLRQENGGRVEINADGQLTEMIQTNGAPGAGLWEAQLTPGEHLVGLRTLDKAPVRLFGWTLENPTGVTVETLGINGAWNNIMLAWDNAVWSAQFASRQPALIILEYGTNEANSRVWDATRHRTDLTAIISRIRQAAPQAAILMMGPPDCGQKKPLLHLDDVIQSQRQFAREQNIAFFDWRAHMGGDRSVIQWVTAGFGQRDYIHLTSDGYRLTAQMLLTALDQAANPSKP